MCKYRLTKKAKKDLQLTLIAIVMLPTTAVAIVSGAFAIVVAIAYPFLGTTANDPISIDITAWSVYLIALVFIIKYSWKWLKENTEECA